MILKTFKTDLKMKILVTGGYGQLGRSLLKEEKKIKKFYGLGKIYPGGEGYLFRYFR